MAKSKRPKAVRAWCVMNNGGIVAHWAGFTRAYLKSMLGPGERIIRVEIRPVPKKRRKARRKA